MALLTSFSQDSTGNKKNSNSHKLKLDEINLVSSYYHQDGNNAAVTGGIGSQKLTDLANVIDLKFIRYDKKERKQTITAGVGIDHYTSASSDKVDPSSISSASHADTRIYPDVSWSIENENRGTTFGLGLTGSNEYDYQSLGANVLFGAKTKNRNGEFSGKLQAYFDKLKVILPVELRDYSNGNGEHYPSASRNSFDATFSYSQIINQRAQMMLIAEATYQEGFLSLPFYRVYFTDGSVHREMLPDTRIKIPVGVRFNYFAGDRFIFKTYYRFYTDDWGMTSHTAELEMPVKINPFLSLSPFYRYYTQSGTDYFAPYQLHKGTEEFYSSNYDLSKFTSNFLGAGIRIVPPNGVFGVQHWNMLEIRYGHYSKNIHMNANILSLNVKFK